MEEREKKICPFLLGKKDKPYCVEAKCGWWNDADSCCSLVVLSNSAINLAEMAVGQRTLYIREF